VSRVADLLARGVRITVGDLPEGTAAEIPAEFFEAAELRPAGRSEVSLDAPDFQPAYAEAGVPAPLRGYGIDKMVEILESKRLAALPREVRIAAVMASLEAAGVSLQQVLKDAWLRERALGGFVAAKEREVDLLRQRNDARIASLRDEIKSYVGERDREVELLEKSSEDAGGAFSKLQLRKRQEQERLNHVLAHFTSDAENPVPKPAKP
jgi:hypothetical protein